MDCLIFKQVSEGLNLIDNETDRKIGKNKLYEFLRNEKILMTDEYYDSNGRLQNGENHNIPYKNETNDKVFRIKLISEYDNGYGEIKKNYKTYVTGYGISWIKKLLLEKRYCSNSKIN